MNALIGSEVIIGVDVSVMNLESATISVLQEIRKGRAAHEEGNCLGM